MGGVAYLNKLWIIESLPEGDLKTGTRLIERFQDNGASGHQALSVALEQPASKDELLAVLNTICGEASIGRYPMLHFECHGSMDGLATANGDHVKWEELKEPLVNINRACRMNLVVLLAACRGIWLIETAKSMDYAPFWAVIGPEHEVSAGSVATDFAAFYRAFFKSLNGDAAILALNRGSEKKRTYHFASAAALFCRAYREYHNTYCIGRGRKERVEHLTSELMRLPDPRAQGVSWARGQVKRLLGDEESYFNKIKERYFFINVYPDNKERFAFTLEDVISGNLP